MTMAQLREFKTAFEKRRAEELAPAPQLYSEKKTNAVSNGQFMI